MLARNGSFPVAQAWDQNRGEANVRSECSYNWLLLLGGICFLLSLSQSYGAEGPFPKMDKGLEFIRLDLSDGKVWMLGEGGVGRPFLARLLLVNRGTEPLRIWDPQNSEGSQCPSVILTDAHGQQTVLRPPPIERSGVASVWTINPNQVVKIDLELLRLIGEKPLAAGDYKVRGFYQNSLDHSGGIKNVWTGYIASETYEIKLIASGRKP